MRRIRVVVVMAVALGLAAAMPECCVSTASARPWCHGPGFGYGNAGYAAGYSMHVGRWAGCRPWGFGGGWGWRGGWGGPGWCGPGWGWRGPVYRPFCRPPVWGRPGWCGNPVFGNPWFGGWYGATSFRGFDSVYLSGPAGGGGTFFSGGVVPAPCFGYPMWGYPTNWLPGCYATPGGVFCTPYGTMLPSGIAPQFGPAGVLPYLGVSAAPIVPGMAAVATAPRAVIAARPPAPGRVFARVSNAAARLRAARLVAIGDRHLRGAGGDPARLNEALDSYRRASAIAEDQPDTFVRQALVLVGLGRRDLADKAIERAVALDGRLGDAAPVQTGDLYDPVFDGHPAGGPSALAARGTAILRAIGGREPAADAAGRSLAALAARWSDRWANGLNAVVATATR